MNCNATNVAHKCLTDEKKDIYVSAKVTIIFYFYI